MITNNDELGRMVLEAVANDYEELEMIISEIVGWTSGSSNDALDRKQIEQALMVSIADKDVEAYRASETSGQLIPALADPQKLRALWFCITEQGKERLRRLEEEDKNSSIGGV